MPPNRDRVSLLVGAKQATALLISLIAHVALFLVLASLVVGSIRSSRDIFILAGSNGSPSQDVQLVSTPEPASSSSQALQVESFSSVAQTIDPIATGIDALHLDVQPASYVSSSLQAGLNGTSESADGPSTGLGFSSGASFFGAYAGGNRFVYVLDSSTSMRGSRWKLARNKLLESLRKLGKGQQFFVICFDAETTLLFDATTDKIEYQNADAATIKRVQRWLQSLELGHNTLPAEALKLALDMRPDAVFLLSDGELRDQSMFMLRQWNADRTEFRQVPIHVVDLISLEGRETLKQIAEENGGTFTFIPGRR